MLASPVGSRWGGRSGWIRWGGSLTSEPTRPPVNSLADPTVWFQLPAARSGSSAVTAPDEEAVTPGSLTVACEASYSAWAFCLLASPWVCSPVLPRTEPTALWTAPVAASTYDWRVEGWALLLDDILMVIWFGVVL